jgi:TRAP-type C4-dicarboxylate transport system permease small subunit
MEKIINILKISDKILFKIIQIISVFCFLVLAVLVAGNVIIRFLSKVIATPSLHWFDEIVVWAFASLVFYGSAALWMTNGHFRLDVLKEKMERHRLGVLINIIVELLILFFISIFAYQSLKLNILVTGWTNVFRIPKKLIYLCLSVSGVIMFIYTIKFLIVEIITFINFNNIKESKETQD